MSTYNFTPNGDCSESEGDDEFSYPLNMRDIRYVFKGSSEASWRALIPDTRFVAMFDKRFINFGDNPSVMSTIKGYVMGWGGRVAGGFVASVLLDEEWEGGDIDIWFKITSEETPTRLLRDITETFDRLDVDSRPDVRIDKLFGSIPGCVINVEFNQKKVQLIYREEHPMDIIAGFDFGFLRIAAALMKTDGDEDYVWKFYQSDYAYGSLMQRECVIEMTLSTAWERYQKYIDRGFKFHVMVKKTITNIRDFNELVLKC